jgi:hypothetical protein
MEENHVKKLDISTNKEKLNVRTMLEKGVE